MPKRIELSKMPSPTRYYACIAGDGDFEVHVEVPQKTPGSHPHPSQEGIYLRADDAGEHGLHLRREVEARLREMIGAGIGSHTDMQRGDPTKLFLPQSARRATK
jgi:hypothetical protein